MNYTVIAQSAEEVQDVQNAPSVSMSPYLISSERTPLLTTLSIYSLRGSTREQVRFLYSLYKCDGGSILTRSSVNPGKRGTCFSIFLPAKS